MTPGEPLVRTLFGSFRRISCERRAEGTQGGHGRQGAFFEALQRLCCLLSSVSALIPLSLACLISYLVSKEIGGSISAVCAFRARDSLPPNELETREDPERRSHGDQSHILHFSRLAGSPVCGMGDGRMLPDPSVGDGVSGSWTV